MSTSTPESNTDATLDRIRTAQLPGSVELKKWIGQQRPGFAKALGDTIDVDQWIRVALTVVLDPGSKLHLCDPHSIVLALQHAADVQLSLTGVTGEAFLIPRRRRGQWVATFQVGYRGYITLAARQGVTVDAREVYRPDVLEYQYGTESFLRHVPDLDEWADPDYVPNPTHFYAVARFADGRIPRFEIWSRERMEAHRDRYAADKREEEAVWWTHFVPMGVKTMIRAVLRQVPLSGQLAHALAVDHHLGALSGPEPPETVVAPPTPPEPAEPPADGE